MLRATRDLTSTRNGYSYVYSGGRDQRASAVHTRTRPKYHVPRWPLKEKGRGFLGSSPARSNESYIFYVKLTSIRRPPLKVVSASRNSWHPRTSLAWKCDFDLINPIACALKCGNTIDLCTRVHGHYLTGRKIRNVGRSRDASRAKVGPSRKIKSSIRWIIIL